MSVTDEDEMATLAAELSDTSPPFHRRRKSWARRVERYCCLTLSYFPLTFVYGLTTWAIWVEIQVSFIDARPLLAYSQAALGLLLYALANASYTVAVFTPPGSPVDRREPSLRRRKDGDYQGVPTYDAERAEEDGNEEEEDLQAPEEMSTVTAKSTGKQRYCKKCKTIKPDRTHHCSSCKQCVLKMDHHCPWLATCVGLHNYKPFLLFLIYTSLFCWACFGVSINWVWTHVLENVAVDDGWRLVNTIMLAVLGGIIGVVLSGFTAWHIWLALRGATTIESLEKTRYLSPIRKSMERQLRHGRNYLGQSKANGQQTLTEQLREIHANALPGVLRPEEGESQTVVAQESRGSFASPAQNSLQRSYASLETEREQDRYESYLDECDSEKLPNAFDLGWRRNMLHLFGEDALLWALPVCNTTGDGWQWDVSQKWLHAREEVARERTVRQQSNARWERHNPEYFPQEQQSTNLRWTPGVGFAPPPAPPRRPYNDGSSNVVMQPLDRRKQDENDSYATSSDEENKSRKPSSETNDWNDIPREMLTAGGDRPSGRSRSTGRSKHD